MRRRVVIALSTIAAVAAALPAGAAVKQLEFANVNTAQAPRITATIKAPGLPKGAKPSFSVFVDGKKATDFEITRAADGSDLAALTDSSHSMQRGGGLAAAKKAVAAFTRGRDQNVRLGIFQFGKTAETVQALTDDSLKLDSAITRIALDPDSGTALYDAIVLSSAALAKSTSPTRRIILLTDGSDEGSKHSLKDAIAAARDAGAPVEAIALGDAAAGGSELRRIAKETGGHVYQSSSSASAIGAIYKQISADIRSSYQLSYVSPSNGNLNLEVRLAGYQPVSTQVTIEGISNSTASSKTVMQELFGNPLLTGLMLGLIVLAMCAVMMREPRAAKMNRLLDKYITPSAPGTAGAKTKRAERASLRSKIVIRSERSFGRSNYFKRVADHLERADMPMRAAELVALQVAGFLAGIFIGFVILSAFIPGILIGPVLALIGSYFPIFWIKRKAKKRRKRFEGQLGEALAAIASSLRAGQSFQQSISSLVKDGPDPLAKEFARVETEIQLGRPSDEALDAMAKRVQSRNFNFVVIAVNIQRQVGGSLSDILDMVSDTVSARVQFARKVKALTAQGRASGYVLLGMPFVMAGLISLIKHDYMVPLFTTLPGEIMMGVGLVLMGIGWLAVNKIVNFKY